MRYGWAAIGVLGALSLTHCTVDRSGLGLAHHVWSCQATVRSSDPEPVFTRLTSDQMELVDGRQFETGGTVGEDPAAAEARVRSKWRLFLGWRLRGDILSETDRMALALGTPPYCLTEDSVTRTPVFFTGTPPADTTPPPIMFPCPELPPPPPTCGNGTGVYPTLTVDSPALVFAALPLGSPAGSMTVTYTNSGDGRMCLNTPMIDRGVASPDPDDFVVDASDCLPTTADDRLYGAIVLPSATRSSCTVLVSFNPRAPGLREAVLRANDQGTQMSAVRLTGMGIGGVLTLAENPICYNVTPLDTGQRRRDVRLSNGGPGAVTVGNAPAGGMGWTVRVANATNTALLPGPPFTPFTIAAGDSVILRIFADGSITGESTLMIDSDAVEPHLRAPLLGPDSGCVPPAP